MTDAELAAGLNLTETEAAKVIPRLAPETRAMYERMIVFSSEWNLYASGFGPPPADLPNVLIDTDRSTKRRKAWR